MPLFTAELIMFLVCVGSFTAVAAVCDMRTRKIPNKLTLPVFFAGLVYQVGFHQLDGLISAAIAFALGFGILLLLWLVGGGGGGDVKLMGALSVWLGFDLTLKVLIASTMLVVLGTFAVIFWNVVTKGARRTKSKYTATGKDIGTRAKPKKETVRERQDRRIMAYASPVAVATWLVVIWKLPTFPF
jgi:prepilin peptidase CpaA